MQAFILPAMGLGLSAALIPGPLLAYLFSTILTRGARMAFLVVLAPLLTDAPIILLMTFVLRQLPEAALQLIQAAGGCLLLSIAWGASRQLQSDSLLTLSADERASSSGATRALLTAVLMNLLSPGPWLFWATVNGPLLLAALELSVLHGLAFLLAFYGVFLGGLCLWIALFHRLRHVDARYLRGMLLAIALLMLWFGAGLITAALQASQFQLPLTIALLALEMLRRAWTNRRGTNHQ
ncbi:MAG: LysE family transporter [Chloroflexi bacterium]|nr:LysE family transporter [Chloroflexota bacterium]MCY3580981.1 LysE family transporter [Chloroflexota bacterium]MXX50650.1 LysE family translocator [Chloroflexota bacterium]MYE78773.1 LysE family translocator [Chloroflexota bacterium]